jgi:hypothetical protein
MKALFIAATLSLIGFQFETLAAEALSIGIAWNAGSPADMPKPVPDSDAFVLQERFALKGFRRRFVRLECAASFDWVAIDKLCFSNTTDSAITFTNDNPHANSKEMRLNQTGKNAMDEAFGSEELALFSMLMRSEHDDAPPARNVRNSNVQKNKIRKLNAVLEPNIVAEPFASSYVNHMKVAPHSMFEQIRYQCVATVSVIECVYDAEQKQRVGISNVATFRVPLERFSSHMREYGEAGAAGD